MHPVRNQFVLARNEVRAVTVDTMSKPFTPAEVAGAKRDYIPGAVFDAFNAEIAKRCDSGRATVSQESVLVRLLAAGLNRREVFDQGWLNIEDAYRDAGWTVTYSKPGYNESGDAYFEFTAGGK